MSSSGKICDPPASFSVAAQTNPPDYYYTGNSPAMIFSLNPAFVSDPAICVSVATYTCSNTGPSDICSAGTFDSLTGDFTFATTDFVTFPRGTYQFSITGTLNGVTDTATFEVVFVDPCYEANLSFNFPTF